MNLTEQDVVMLRTLVESAIAEVDVAAEPDATVQPDSVDAAMSLMIHYEWGVDFLRRLTEAEGR